MAGPDDDLEIDEDEVEDEGQENEPGLLDDEGGDEAEARQKSEDAEGEEGQVAPKPSRSTKAVQEAKRIAREATADKAKLEREVAELRAERQRSEPKGETPEQEAARLALMTVEERVDYKLDKAKKEHERALGVVRFQSVDAADKAAYQAKGAYDPRFTKYAAEVEQVLANTRRDTPHVGMSLTREDVLQYVLGRKVLANRAKATEQRANGNRNIQRQRTTPDSSRSDRAAPRGRTGTGNALADLERRLEGVEI